MANLGSLLSDVGAGVRQIGDVWQREAQLEKSMYDLGEVRRMERFRELEADRLRNMPLPQARLPNVSQTFARLGEGEQMPVLPAPPRPAAAAPTAPAAPAAPAQPPLLNPPDVTSGEQRLAALRQQPWTERDVGGVPEPELPRIVQTQAEQVSLLRQRVMDAYAGVERAPEGSPLRAQLLENYKELNGRYQAAALRLDELRRGVEDTRVEQIRKMQETYERGQTEAGTKAAQATARLVDALPTAVKTEPVQAVVNRARMLGVDPYAAVAIFGIESSFGAQAGTSTAGAKGGMQVTDETFRAMKRFFTDPQKIQKYNIPQAQQDAARAMTRGSTQGEVDAGLLRLKYNELIGVPANLWGAAYQANAEKVRDAGSPLNVSDGALMNAEYNDRYLALYNNLRQMYGQQPVGAAAAPAAAAPAAAAPAAAAPAAAAPAAAAPAAAAPAAAAATPVTALMRPESAAEDTPPPSRFYAGRADMVRMDQQLLEGDYRQSRQNLLNQYQATRTELEGMYQSLVQSGRTLEAMKVREQMLQLNAGVQGQLTDMDQKYRTGRLVIDGQTAVTQLEYAGDPRAANTILTAYMGQQVAFQPRADGKFVLNLNGQVQGVYSRKDVSDMVKNFVDENWRKASGAMRAMMATETFKANLKLQDTALGKQYDMVIQQIKEDAATRRLIMEAAIKAGEEGRKATIAGREVKIVRTSDNNVVIYTPDGSVLGTMNTEAVMAEGPGGMQIQRPSRFVPAAGMNTATAPAR
jgi:hypothetical protein